SIQTTKNHCHEIYRKLGVSNKGQCLIKCGPLVQQWRKQTKLERIIAELQDLSGSLESAEQRQAVEDTVKILRVLATLSEG
ncbi:unnamed protein product, partial [marine sediment metagenome]